MPPQTTPTPITPQVLSKLLTSTSSTANTIAIIDVRDADHVGGHIASSQHIPSTTLDAALPSLVQQLKNEKTVVFHCMLSQVRGPEAARKYLVEKERVRVRGSVGLVAGEASQEQDLEQVQEQEQEQEVFVLVGGFEAWQRLYGKDPKLTANFAEDIYNSLW